MWRDERGQALLEGVVMMGMLATMLMAAGVIGRYADVRLAAEHALQFQLFDQARRLHQAPRVAMAAPWRDARGMSWLTADRMTSRSIAGLAEQDASEPGLAGAWASSLRREDAVRVDLSHDFSFDAGLRLGGVAQLPGLRLQRSLYRGSGAALDENAVSAQLQDALPVWGGLQARHRPLLQGFTARLAPLDAVWSRSRADSDWLRPIQNLVPEDRLVRRWP